MTNNDGKLVRLESGAWAQYRQIPVVNAVAPMLVAVELTDDEVRDLLETMDAEVASDALH